MAKTVVIQKQNLPPRLLVFHGQTLRSYLLGSQIIVGRKTATNTVGIDLSVDFVSRRHGQFGADESGIYYSDTASTNGTVLNGQKVAPGYKYYLRDGDVLHIYKGTPQTDSDFVCMVFTTEYPADYEHDTIDLCANLSEVSIGRTGARNLLMPSTGVSANHASFFRAAAGWAITDHQSTNGVFVNSARIFAPQYLKIGDCVRIANTYFVFAGGHIVYQKIKPFTKTERLLASGVEDTPLEIHITERSVWQRARKLMLLQNINMTINNGEMVLILGGSGAGKTTFMNAVMGYEKAEGRILHGNTDLYEDFELMKYKIGFVPQQDLIRGGDTVLDTLKNAAELKMSVGRKERLERIERVLETLGLQREKTSLVSKLSGGQRKRLSIAVEYISNPSLFFLDEPDSGLDGIMAKSLMQNLRQIADEGKIVMVISHAPDRAAELFDKVIVLAKSTRDNCGHLAFWGSIDEAKKFFNASSLEEVVKRINRPDEGGDGLSDYYIDQYQTYSQTK